MLDSKSIVKQHLFNLRPEGKKNRNKTSLLGGQGGNVTKTLKSAFVSKIKIAKTITKPGDRY